MSWMLLIVEEGVKLLQQFQEALVLCVLQEGSVVVFVLRRLEQHDGCVLAVRRRSAHRPGGRAPAAAALHDRRLVALPLLLLTLLLPALPRALLRGKIEQRGSS